MPGETKLQKQVNAYGSKTLVPRYVSREALEDVSRLSELVRFMKRMGRETKQAAVAVVINDAFHEITEF